MGLKIFVKETQKTAQYKDDVKDIQIMEQKSFSYEYRYKSK